MVLIKKKNFFEKNKHKMKILERSHINNSNFNKYTLLWSLR